MINQTPVARPPVVIRLLAHDLRWQLVSALARSDRRAQELVAILCQPANLVSYHLNKLRHAQLLRDREACTTLPGDPEQIHWSFAAPAAVQGTEARRRAFQKTATELTTRINYLLLVISVERGKQRRQGNSGTDGG